MGMKGNEGKRDNKKPPGFSLGKQYLPAILCNQKFWVTDLTLPLSVTLTPCVFILIMESGSPPAKIEKGRRIKDKLRLVVRD